jgi:hypothetical protein
MKFSIKAFIFRPMGNPSSLSKEANKTQGFFSSKKHKKKIQI